MRTKEDILNEIEDKKTEIEESQEELKNLEDGNKYDLYDEWLDDIDGDIKIGSLSYSASHVLKNVDEIAYNCGYNDFVESERDNYEDKIKELEGELQDLEEELKEFEEIQNSEMLSGEDFEGATK